MTRWKRDLTREDWRRPVAERLVHRAEEIVGDMESMDIEVLRTTRRMLNVFSEALTMGAIEDTARTKTLMAAETRVRDTIIKTETATKQDVFIRQVESMAKAAIAGTSSDADIKAMTDDPTSWGVGSSDTHVRTAVCKAALDLAGFAIQQFCKDDDDAAAQTCPARVGSVILSKCMSGDDLAGVQDLTVLLAAAEEAQDGLADIVTGRRESEKAKRAKSLNDGVRKLNHANRASQRRQSRR